ncbi:sigma-54-dependent Fis family transcriptional regulator [Thalassotalea insulae]|uniref:Sigma-54-dependent Fis family transcriptional regulator n=1 Tax=Thalassotalea insulae TaxID=2056778 RepID=A0ABQ6GSP8_9GAMM|nr:sigma-54 dependent transcriptional regulator [Thalassotalea insulae]GLX78349.1 sigma-54-dependent Fis family transcriptional regulator [Thalassotalea insulae]
MSKKILVIDDNPDVAKALQVLFTLNGMCCDHQLTPQDGLAALAAQHYDLVLQDMNFTQDTTSGEEGIQLFKQIRQQWDDLPIILMTAWTSLETAVELVKSGASDYISKPWDDDKLIITINNLIELNDAQRSNHSHALKQHRDRRSLAEKYDLCGLRFQSTAMLNLLQIATQVAHSDVSVLITGPNGTGKEKIAEIVQKNSSCANGPFIKVNVGALPQDLMAAELFGAEAGAYTGITKRRLGRFELADHGTLFLDEIGNLSLDGQAKLLRVLETGEFERIGGSETIKVKVRIISATNADLKTEIAKGNFREDLYYRLNVIELPLQALNQRKADILPLAEHFLGESFSLTEQAAQVLKYYPWPGNIRELKNVMQRAALLAQDNLVSADVLGLDVVVPELVSRDEELTAQDITQAISDAGGVISEAAKQLGLSRSALYRRMKKFEID